MSLMIKAAWGVKTGVPSALGVSRVRRRGANLPPFAQAGEGPGQLQQADLGVAHHHTQAVVLRGEFRAVDELQPGQRVVVSLRSHQVEQVDGGEVQGIAQGLPERNGAVGDAIEIGRNKLAPGSAVAPFHVFQHRGGREPLVQGQGVEKRFERGTRRAPGGGAVVEAPVPGAIGAGAHQGQDFPGAVGDDHRGRLGGPGLEEPDPVRRHDGLGPPLERQIQGRPEPLGTRGRRSLPGQDQVDKMRGFKGERRRAGAVAPEPDGV